MGILPYDTFPVPLANVAFGTETTAWKFSFQDKIVKMHLPINKHWFKRSLFVSEGGGSILDFLRAISSSRRVF